MQRQPSRRPCRWRRSRRLAWFLHGRTPPCTAGTAARQPRSRRLWSAGSLGNTWRAWQRSWMQSAVALSAAGTPANATATAAVGIAGACSPSASKQTWRCSSPGSGNREGPPTRSTLAGGTGARRFCDSPAFTGATSSVQPCTSSSVTARTLATWRCAVMARSIWSALCVFWHTMRCSACSRRDTRPRQSLSGQWHLLRSRPCGSPLCVFGRLAIGNRNRGSLHQSQPAASACEVSFTWTGVP
mmetsp:Transcript_119673/g.372081  ORF Transcript_119673/g.372081 Transcript_119673/m.372081 type:complete len:243 (-) Transcript_119673:1-729(-)